MKNKLIVLSIILIVSIMTGCESSKMNKPTNESDNTTFSANKETAYTQSIVDENKIIPKSIKRNERGNSIDDYSDFPLSDKEQMIDDI